MTRRRILIVDDSPFVCRALSVALRTDFDVDVAHDVWAFEADDSNRPDLILMDVVLQEAYGDEIAELLRETRGLTCPIVLLSALAESELKQRVADAQLAGYITKRAGLAGIVERVHRLLDATPAPPHSTPATAFAVIARQRVRRIVHVLAQPGQWSASAIVAELYALLGDADLVGAADISNAARMCHDVVAAGDPAHVQALAKLAELVGATHERPRRVLVIDDRPHDDLIAQLDAAGDVVFEARSLAEARQKLRATDYDVVVVDASVDGGKGTALIGEIRGRSRGAKLVLVGGDGTTDVDAALAHGLDPAELVQRLAALAPRN